MKRWRLWAQRIKREVHALVLATRDPRTPRYAKLVAIGVAAYALSPIDLIPDMIPVLGYLDDFLIVPGGIVLALRLVPAEVISDARMRAAALDAERVLGRRGAVAIVVLWIVALISSAAAALIFVF